MIRKSLKKQNNQKGDRHQMSSTISVHESEPISHYMRFKASLSSMGVTSSEEQASKAYRTRTTANIDCDQILSKAISGYKTRQPVYVENGTIKVNSKKLEIGKQYHVILDDRKYVLVKPREGVIDLYELAD